MLHVSKTYSHHGHLHIKAKIVDNFKLHPHSSAGKIVYTRFCVLYVVKETKRKGHNS